MAFIRKSGTSKLYEFPRSGVAFANGEAVILNASGYVDKALAASVSIVGIAKETLLATDLKKTLLVEMFNDESIFEVDTSTTVTQAMVGTTRDLTNSLTLNVGAAGTVNQFRILGLGTTTTKALVTCIKDAFSN